MILKYKTLPSFGVKISSSIAKITNTQLKFHQEKQNEIKYTLQRAKYYQLVQQKRQNGECIMENGNRNGMRRASTTHNLASSKTKKRAIFHSSKQNYNERANLTKTNITKYKKYHDSKELNLTKMQRRKQRTDNGDRDSRANIIEITKSSKTLPTCKGENR